MGGWVQVSHGKKSESDDLNRPKIVVYTSSTDILG